MEILFVVEYYSPHLGGIQVLFENVAQRLVDRGHDVTVLTSRTDGTEKRERRDGVSVVRAPVIESLDRYTFTVTGLPGAVSLASSVDVIHTSTWTGSVPAWVARLVTDTPTLMTVHEVFAPIWDLTDRGPLDRALHRTLERGIYALPFDRYTCVSEYTRRCLLEEGKPSGAVDVVHNGIDTDLFDPAEVTGDRLQSRLALDEEFVYMYFGRPGFSKGVEYLVEAVPSITERVPGSHLVLILGRSPRDRYDRIRRRVDELGVEDSVTILDPVDREVLPEFVGSADCVVVPSLSEGFGFTAAEACALEVPVVATTAGALPEVVSGEHRLVEPCDERALADGIVDVYEGNADWRPKREFAWDRAVDEYVEIYRGLVDSVQEPSRTVE
jgi:glycosyltransferase involved in cell wall biosynthesis